MVGSLALQTMAGQKIAELETRRHQQELESNSDLNTYYGCQIKDSGLCY